MLRVLLVQISYYTLFLTFAFMLPAHAAGQLDFERKSGASRLVLEYQLQALDRSIHNLSFSLDRVAVEQAAQQFKPVNARLLRQEAQAERARQTQTALNELQLDYPQVEFKLAANNAVRWKVSVAKDYSSQRRLIYDQLMTDEFGDILRRHPKAKIHLADTGSYKISANSQHELKEIRRDLERAMQRSQQAVSERDEEQQQKVQLQSEEIRERLIKEVDRVTGRMQDFELNYYQERWYQEYQENGLLPDYARIANAALPDLQPVALRLRSWLSGLPRREAINRLLLLVQSIPYDRLDNRATDAGFLVPLSVLAENRGDCDSKSVLFAALLRKLYPGMPVSMVLLKQHALVAIGLNAQQDDVSLRHAHRDWVLAEPVGPAILPLGSVGEQFKENPQGIESVMRLF